MRSGLLLTVLTASVAIVVAQEPATPSTYLTIYNQDFAVARTQVQLDLHPGINEVSTNQVTTQLEPDSVVLRDSSLSDSAQPGFRILEQNYDAAVVTQDWLLQKYEGKTIDFALGNMLNPEGKVVPGGLVQGKIIRAPQTNPNEYGGYQQIPALIEVDGKMQFQLPGTPLFPATTDGILLKPTLRWRIQADRAQKLAAELAYVTGGLTWEATYNVVAPYAGEGSAKTSSSDPAAGETANLVGWVSITNRSGTDFPNARIKLMAGDVAKIAPRNRGRAIGMDIVQAASVAPPQVTQQAFDDFHLYDLNRAASLPNGEMKQIEFLEASGVTLKRTYLYDGSQQNLQNYQNYGVNQQQNFGIDTGNSKVRIVEEFKNSQANHLGVPLPAGRIRFYRRGSEGQMEFIGESTINHTPTEDVVKIATGSAFDIKGSRRQTSFYVDGGRRELDETFEIKLTNQKPETVNVNVLEHMYRGDNWEIEKKTADYTQLDSHTIQFPVSVPAKGEATLTYTVNYSW
jgi:hypothetical protein